jgi:ABC-type dipeptide/oligopeptide/nickel transport system ATPase component
VAPGETLGIVGESGSGKSVTVLSVLGPVRGAGMVHKSSRALFRGTDLAQAEPAATGGHLRAGQRRRLSGPDLVHLLGTMASRRQLAYLGLSFTLVSLGMAVGLGTAAHADSSVSVTVHANTALA